MIITKIFVSIKDVKKWIALGSFQLILLLLLSTLFKQRLCIFSLQQCNKNSALG